MSFVQQTITTEFCKELRTSDHKIHILIQNIYKFIKKYKSTCFFEF